MKIKDELPTGLEFVEGSERAEGENPKPLYVKVKNGIVLAEYPEITDMKERSIVFKVKVKEKAKVGEEIVNKAIVEDTINHQSNRISLFSLNIKMVHYKQKNSK